MATKKGKGIVLCSTAQVPNPEASTTETKMHVAVYKSKDTGAATYSDDAIMVLAVADATDPTLVPKSGQLVYVTYTLDTQGKATNGKFTRLKWSTPIMRLYKD